MPQSVTIISKSTRLEPKAFKIIVDGHELNDIVSYELKESQTAPPTVTVTMEVYESLETYLEASSKPPPNDTPAFP